MEDGILEVHDAAFRAVISCRKATFEIDHTSIAQLPLLRSSVARQDPTVRTSEVVEGYLTLALQRARRCSK